jgi:hypothetical protein
MDFLLGYSPRIRKGVQPSKLAKAKKTPSAAANTSPMMNEGAGGPGRPLSFLSLYQTATFAGVTTLSSLYSVSTRAAAPTEQIGEPQGSSGAD